MLLELTPEERAFQQEVRQFLEDNLTPDLVEAGRGTPSVFVEKDIHDKWQAILHARGWAAPSWPEEHGGTGWSATQRYLFQTECARAGAPALAVQGLKLVAPVIYTFGTDEQKAEFLPKLLSGKHFWSQGFSEPGSGSDLASLSMSAVRDGDDYVLNGSKIWTTFAHHSNWIFLLVRTDREGKPQAGITFLLAPMDLPGIEIRPIITMAGDHEVNQVFFDDVRVPVSNRVGAEGQGWEIAKFLLANERGGGSMAPGMLSQLAAIRDRARTEPDGMGGYLIDDPDFARDLARVEVEAMALEMTELRILDKLERGAPLGAEASVAKLVGSNLRQAIDELSVSLHAYAGLQLETARPLYGTQGPEGVGAADAIHAMPTYLNSRAWTIFGGSDEVQKTILAKSVLGL